MAALGGFLFGLDAIIVSGAIPLIRAQYAMASATEGLFVAASLIGCAGGSFGAGPLADTWGRRPLIAAAGLLTIAGVLLSVVADSTTQLVLARFLGGAGVGAASMACPLYIAEIAPAHLRGRLVSLYQFAITLGIVVALFSNAGVLNWCSRPLSGGNWLTAEPWRAMFAVQLVPALAFALLAFSVPESPRWLLDRGQTDDAARALARLGQTTDQLARASQRQDPTERNYKQLFAPAIRRPLFVAVALGMLSELSGITVVFYYGPTLLASAGVQGDRALGGFAVLGVINMAATLIGVALIDHLGRRPLLAIGSGGGALCLGALGMLIGSAQPSLAAMAVLTCVFVALFAASIGPIKFVVAAEIFPARVRSRGAALAVTVVWLTGALINQLFPVVRDAFGPAVMFLGFCAALLVQLIFIKTVMPETASQSLEEIESSW